MDITEQRNEKEIRQLFNEGKRISTSSALCTGKSSEANQEEVVRVKSFLGVRRIVKYNDRPESPD